MKVEENTTVSLSLNLSQYLCVVWIRMKDESESIRKDRCESEIYVGYLCVVSIIRLKDENDMNSYVLFYYGAPFGKYR